MKSRRLERKNARKEKKLKRNAFYKNRNKSKTEEEIEEKSETIIETKFENKNKIKKSSETKNNEKVRKLSFKQKRDIEREDKEIKRLEKKLKLNRRKRKGKLITTIPKSFKMDGLDYILDVVDSQKLSQNSDNEEMVSEEEEQQNNSSDQQHSSDDQEFSDNQELSDDNSQDSEIESEMKSDIEMDRNEDNDNQLKEDIYGFIRDKSGNIVNKPESDLKEKLISKESGSGFSEQILRRIRGSLNRLTVNNLMTISGQIKELFDQNSRHSVNEALFQSMSSFLIDLEYISPPKLKTESALLIAILHHIIGDEVGGHAIHSCIFKFNELLKGSDFNETKKIDNLIIFILNLYVCGLIESLLIYEILTKLCDNFTEKSIELIGLILKSVGFVLRKDNAIKMKELIQRIQTEAKNVDKSSLSGNRITFLLDSLIAIKNNNMTKLKGYGTEVDVQLIELSLKSNIKKSRVNSISGSYDAILQSSHWYSFTKNIETINSDEKQTNEWKSVDNKMNEQLFKALRLNTPLRKTIVSVLTSCNDYMDAGNRIISVGKKQFSEVVNVLIHVAIHENQFNPFYSHLFQHLSQCDRKYKVSLKSV